MYNVGTHSLDRRLTPQKVICESNLSWVAVMKHVYMTYITFQKVKKNVSRSIGRKHLQGLESHFFIGSKFLCIFLRPFSFKVDLGL